MPNMPQQDYNALLKLFCLLIAKQGGEVRLSAADIHEAEPPKGYFKKWDNATKELVLTVVEHGTAIYVTEDNQWTTQPARPTPLGQQSAESLAAQVEAAWTGQPPASRSPQPASHIVLDDETVAEIDRKRRMQAALREIVEFPSQASSELASRAANSTSSSARPQAATEMPRQFFKT